VISQPAVWTLYWLIDHNGTTLVAGQIVREYWTLVLVSLYVLLSLLVSLFLFSSSFRFLFNGGVAIP